MSIYADKKDGKPTGRWCVEVTKGTVRKRGRFDSMASARQVEALWKAGMFEGGTTKLAVERSLADLPRLCAPALWPNNRERVADVERKVRLLVGWVGNPPLSDMDYLWITNMCQRLSQEGRAPSTINRYLTALHPMLKHAVKAGWLDKMPEFKWQDEDQGRIRWLTDDEEAALLAHLRRAFPHIADFVTVAIDTGCRRGELLAAQPSWLMKGWLHIPAQATKSGKPRSIPLTPRAHEVLSRALPWAININHLRYAWEQAKGVMGLEDDPWFVLHACRHTCATRLVMKGVNLVVVRDWMGHTDIKTTTRYAHVSPDMLLDAVSRLGGK